MIKDRSPLVSFVVRRPPCMVEVWERVLNLRLPRRESVSTAVQAVEVVWWISEVVVGLGTPTPANLTGRERRVRSAGGVPLLGQVPRRAGRKCCSMASSTGSNAAPMLPIDRWKCIYSDCRLFWSPAKAHCGELWATLASAFTPATHPTTFASIHCAHAASSPIWPPR